MTEGGTTGAIVRFSLPMMGGALLQQLSRRSETVIRIFCGLPQQLKP